MFDAANHQQVREIARECALAHSSARCARRRARRCACRPPTRGGRVRRSCARASPPPAPLGRCVRQPLPRGGAAACVAALRRAEAVRAQQHALSSGEDSDSSSPRSLRRGRAGAESSPSNQADASGFFAPTSDPDEPPAPPTAESHHHVAAAAATSSSGRQRRLCYSEAEFPIDLRTPPSPPTPDLEATRQLLTRLLDEDSRSPPTPPELTRRVAYNPEHSRSPPREWLDNSRPRRVPLASENEPMYSTESSASGTPLVASRGLSTVHEFGHVMGLVDLDDVPTPPRRHSFDAAATGEA